MTIQSLNAYSPSRPLDSRIDRTWATKSVLAQLQEQIDQLKKAIEENIEVRNRLTDELKKSEKT